MGSCELVSSDHAVVAVIASKQVASARCLGNLANLEIVQEKQTAKKDGFMIQVLCRRLQFLDYTFVIDEKPVNTSLP